jgi:CheY-like chemotaxis protein
MTSGAGRILLVEDFPGLSSVTTKLLRRAGYDVVLAESGERALELLAESGEPDLIISDISLPGISGIELARQVRRTLPHMKMLLTSGSMEHAAAISSLGGTTLFIAKPYHGEDLISRIRDLTEMPPRRRKSDRNERKGEAC